jgi:hypothetical protein
MSITPLTGSSAEYWSGDLDLIQESRAELLQKVVANDRDTLLQQPGQTLQPFEVRVACRDASA